MINVALFISQAFPKEKIIEPIEPNCEKPLADSFSKIHANVDMDFVSEIS